MNYLNQRSNHRFSSLFSVADEAIFKYIEIPIGSDRKATVLHVHADLPDNIKMTEGNIYARVYFIPGSGMPNASSHDFYLITAQVGPEKFSWLVGSDNTEAMRALRKCDEDKRLTLVMSNLQNSRYGCISYKFEMSVDVKKLKGLGLALDAGVADLDAEDIVPWCTSHLEAWPKITKAHFAFVKPGN